MASKIIQSGKCECIYMPMGDHGLEGFQLDTIHPFEKVITKDDRTLMRVYPGPPFTDYFENCTPAVFKRYFKEVPA